MKSVPLKNSPKTTRRSASAKGMDGDVRKQRSDGVEARERLLHMALRLFAEKGFAKTSTREIAQSAGVNLAAIKYYFGDKAGLYRAAFTERMACSCETVAPPNQTQLTLRQMLEEFFTGFLSPIKQGDLARLYMRLHFRERLEPTGLLTQEIDSGLKLGHDMLIAALALHFGVAKADDDMHRLAFSIGGLALPLFVSRGVIDAVHPRLINTPAAIDQWATRLADYAEAMVAVEAAYRKAIAIKKKKT